MNLKEAVAVAKHQVNELFDAPQNIRLEQFLYDDHLGVWALTIGFALPGRPEARGCKIIRVAEADKSILSVKDG